MEKRRENKRHCPGNAVFVRAAGLRGLGGGLSHINQRERMGTQISDLLVIDWSPPADRHRVLGSVVEMEGGRELKDLHADLLGEEFSYLAQQDRLQAMLVSKYWEKVQREGNVAWRKVCVAQHWDLRYKGKKKGQNSGMFRVLKAAEELKFSPRFHNDSKYIMSLKWVLGANLRSLELPRLRVPMPLFHSFLAACPQLQSLVFESDPEGFHPMRISHPRLERLLLRTSTIGPSVTVNCPRLTHLATTAPKDGQSNPVIGALEAFQELRELSVHACHRFFSPPATCPSLESLTVRLGDFWLTQAGNHCLRDLNSVCPRLKRAVVRESANRGEGVVLDLFHEALEEVEVVGSSPLVMRLTCPNLGKLRRTCTAMVCNWTERKLTLEVECPKLSELRVRGYPNFACLPSILSALPGLEILQLQEDVNFKSAMVLNHARIREEVIERCFMEKIVLAMCSLTQVRFVHALGVQWLQVDCAQQVSVELEGHGCKERSRKVFEAGEMIDIDLTNTPIFHIREKTSPFYVQTMG